MTSNSIHCAPVPEESGTPANKSKDIESETAPKLTAEEQKLSEQISKILADALNNVRESKDTESEAADKSAHAKREVYNIPEAAYYMHTAIRTLRDLIAKGEIKYVRFNRRIYLRKQDCDAFIAKHVI